MINNININPNSLFLNTRDFKWKAAVICTIVVFLILFLLQPFNDIVHGFTLSGILRILSYALVVGLTVLLTEFCLIKGFKKLFPRNGFYLPLIWYSLTLVLVTTAVFIMKNAWSDFAYMNWHEYGIVVKRTLSIAIFPLILLFVFLLNQKKKSDVLNLQADQKNEFLSINQDQLLYLQSQDNYTEVHYIKNDELRKKLLRGSLSSFEKQLDYPLFRCHRSYIVNLLAIESLKGNSQGYQLSLRHGETSIKVSRKYASDFRKNWTSHCDKLRES